MLQSNYLIGINTLNNSTYFLTWAYQTGFVLYQTFILKIFNNTFALNILDCLYGSLSCVLIYLISNKLFKDKIASCISAFLYTISFFGVAYCGVLTNQHLFTLLILLCTYIIIYVQTSFKRSLLLGLILAFANVIRPETIVYVLAIVAYMVLNINNKKDIKKYIINILIILMVYFTIFQSASFIIQRTKVNENGLSNNNPLWKLVCGLDYNTKGQYSLEGEKFFDNNELELEFIKNNLKMPLNNYLELFKDKIKIFWQHNNYNWIFQNTNITLLKDTIINSNLINIVANYDKTLYLITLSFLLIYLINIMINKKVKNEEILLMLMIIINFFVYLIIEVQARYSYTIKICLYILSTGGISYIINLLNGKCIKKRKEREKND